MLDLSLVGTVSLEIPILDVAVLRRLPHPSRQGHDGAGGGAGGSDAANLLKPALARGELRTIAATTWSEYKKYFEKDAALARRFQVIKVEEPEEETALVMMRAVAPFLEKHHQVSITDSALLDSVRLSHRYLTGRQLPDKSVSVLDTACARVAIGLTTHPPAIEEAQRRIAQIESEMKILKGNRLWARTMQSASNLSPRKKFRSRPDSMS